MTTRRARLEALEAELDRHFERTDAQAAALRAEIAQLKAQIQRFGEDIYEDGNVLFFQKQFWNGATYADYTSLSRVYDYVALKCTGKWFVTGYNAGRMYSWDALLDFVMRDSVLEDPNFHIVTGWEQL